MATSRLRCSRLGASVAWWRRSLTGRSKRWSSLNGGQVALVCSCRYRARPAVLKVSPRQRDQTSVSHETEALRLWTGLAPEVLAARDDGWTVLLERLEPGLALADCQPLLGSLEILGGLARELHRYPSNAEFPPLATGPLGQAWRRNLQRNSDALTELDDLLSTGGDSVLLHGDLQPTNVLLHRGRWRVIDPKPHRGDPHAECFLFLGFASHLPREGAAETVDQWLSIYSAAAGLERARVERWIKVWAQAELGWWPEGEPGWGPSIARLLAAL